MIPVLLAIHLMLALALVGVVLIQRSEGGGLGIGGGGGMSGLMSGRGTANLLTRTTAILAAAFFASSLTLAILESSQGMRHSILDQPGTANQGTMQVPIKTPPANAPATNAPPASAPAAPPSGGQSGGGGATGAKPAQPSAPLSQ